VTGDWRSDVEEWRSGDRDDRGAPLRGARQVAAILPNGRTLWLGIDPPLASAASVDRLAQWTDRLATTRAHGIRSRSEALDRLARGLAEEVERLEAKRLGRVEAFRRRLLTGDRKLDTQLSKAREELHARLTKQLETDDENVRRFRRRRLWDTILVATALPLFAAYGDRDDPFGSNNLTLVLTLLIFLMGDELVEAVFANDRDSSASAVKDADVWSYLAPLANVVAGWWLLGDRQHQRFITGMATVPLENVRVDLRAPGGPQYRYTAQVDLRPQIAVDHVPDFETFANVPAVAALGGVRLSSAGEMVDAVIDGLAAKVDRGTLKLSFVARVRRKRRRYPTALGEIDLAWMVDTKKPTALSRT
jgi:hypothetical protein